MGREAISHLCDHMARLGSLRFFVGLALFLLGTPTVSAGSGCGMDILGICNAAKTLAPVIDNLPDHIRAAAEAVADHLFNVDLPPAIDKMTAAAKALEDRAEHDYEEALNATSKAVYELAKKALALTEQLAANVTKDVEEVVQEVQTAISQDIDKLFTDIDNSVNKLLTQLEKDGKELFCAVESWMNTFQNTISTYFSAQDCQCVQEMLELNPGIVQDCECTSCFHIAGFYPKCSCKPLGFAFDSYHSKMKYDFLKCHQEKPIDWQTWTVDQILSQLGTLQAAALGFRCLEDMNPGSTIVRDYFSNEYTNISYTIDVWKNTGASQQLNLRQSAPVYHAAAESTNVVAQVSPIVENTHASAGADSCTGKTIQQCVTDAMAQLQQAQKALQQAQQQFATSVPPLQAAVGKNSADIKTGAASVDSVIKKVDANAQLIIKKVDANAQLISDLSTTVEGNHATLESNMGWCDCYNSAATMQAKRIFPTQCDNPNILDLQCMSGYMVVRMQTQSYQGSLDDCKIDGRDTGGGVGVVCCRPCYK